MPFDWSKYFALAQELAQDANRDEAKLRSAISRAYYAAFITARNHLRDKDKVLIQSNSTAHSFVINRFSTSRSRVRRDIGFKLEILRDLRNSADYDDTIKRLNRATRKAIEAAEEIINSLAQL